MTLFMDAFLPLFMRALGMAALLPFPGADFYAPQRVACAGLTAAFFSLYAGAECSKAGLIAEFSAGVFLTMPVFVICGAVQLFIEFFEFGRGQNISALYDPQQETEVSVFAGGMRQLTWTILLRAGFLEQLLLFYKKNLVLIPAGTELEVWLRAAGGKLGFFTVSLLDYCCLYFLPISLIFVLIDFGIGLIGKTLPQAGGLAESYVLKSCLGFFIVSSYAGLFPQAALLKTALTGFFDL